MLYAVAIALALMSGWTAYRLRRGDRTAAAAIVCAVPLLLALPLFVPGVMPTDGDGMGVLALQAIAVILFGPSFLAAVLGAFFGWLKTRS